MGVVATLHEVSWSIDGRGAARGLISREGLVLEIRTATGGIGRGEAPVSSTHTSPSASRDVLGSGDAMSVPPTTPHPPNDERIYGIYVAAPGVVSAAVDGAG